MFCKQCGKQIEDGQELCEECKANAGANQTANNQAYQSTSNTYNNANTINNNPNAKSKIAAGILGILLGSFGVHNFYLGYTGKGIAQLLITLLTCGFGAFISSVCGLIEGILILTGSITTDANGVPLKD